MPSSKYPPQCQHILVKRWTYHLFHQLNHSFFHFFHSMKWPSFWSLNHKLKIIQNPSSLVDTSSQVSFKSVPYPLCLVNPIHLQSYTQLLVFLGEPLWTAHFSLSSRDRTQWSHGVKIMNFRTLQAERKIQLLLILAQFLTYGRPSVNICSGVDWNALSPASPPLLWFCPLPPGLQQDCHHSSRDAQLQIPSQCQHFIERLRKQQKLQGRHEGKDGLFIEGSHTVTGNKSPNWDGESSGSVLTSSANLKTK